jgi:hypothetical protein
LTAEITKITASSGSKIGDGTNPSSRPADKTSDNRPGRHQQYETPVFTENNEAAIPAVAREADEHRRQAHGQRQAAGEFDIRAEPYLRK